MAHGAEAVPPQSAAAGPQDVRGIQREASEPGDDARAVGNAFLYLPRQTVELFFRATGAVEGLIEDEQVVPRVRNLLHPPEGEISAFPTLFAETGSSFNVGVRFIARARNLASSLRVGYGGSDAQVIESRLRYSHPEPLPLVLSLEAFADRAERGFLGVGQDPETDSRNRFDPASGETGARFVEVRERFITGLGARLLADAELFLSSSLRFRRTEDPSDPSLAGLHDVFLPGSIPAALQETRFVYSELTARIDTRRSRGGPSSGLLIESYGGYSAGFGGTQVGFYRAGGRLATFHPVVRSTNILSPKLVLDTLGHVRGTDVPFNELTGQPDFRGFDNRRDDVSVVASLDYRWAIWRYAAARLLVDAATVAPRISSVSLDHLRWAGGFGLDLFSDTTPLGAMTFVGSPEGFLFHFRFGVASGFGDRQHR